MAGQLDRRGEQAPQDPDLSARRVRQSSRDRRRQRLRPGLDTIHRVDLRCFENLATPVNEEHPDAIDPETAVMLATIGIAHGQPFEPDERMTRILSESAKVDSAMALATSYRTRLPLQRYDDRQWIEIGNTWKPTDVTPA